MFRVLTKRFDHRDRWICRGPDRGTKSAKMPNTEQSCRAMWVTCSKSMHSTAWFPALTTTMI